jgi:hypothetical protein
MVTTHAPLDNTRMLAIKRLHRLPNSAALLLDVLLDGGVVTPKTIIECGIAPSEVSARAVVCKLRKHLKAGGVQIQSQYGTGYWLDKAERDYLMSGLSELLPGGVNG